MSPLLSVGRVGSSSGVRMLALALVLSLPGTAWAQLRVSQASPSGELQRLADASEIRVAFSEPMLELGQPSEPVAAPFFSVSPATAGSLRWSGTDVLVFTPAAPFAWGTRYQVTLAQGARAASGSTLAQAYSFSFATPSLKLERANWYREAGRSDSPLVIALQFNQPVTAAALRGRLQLRHQPYPFEPPPLPRSTLARLRQLDPQALSDYEARRAALTAVAASREPVAYDVATAWDERRFPRRPEQVVIRTRSAPSPNAWLSVRAADQEQLIKLEPGFMVTGLRCTSACDPDGYNPIRFPLHVATRALRGKLRVFDITDVGRERELTPRAGEAATDDFEPDYGDGYDYDRSIGIALEDLGYLLEPARVYAIGVDKSVVSADGQRLGYTWMGPLENWRRRAFSSFGAGHGVWEKGGGPLLPYSARNLRQVTEWVRPLTAEELMPTVLSLRENGFAQSPDGPGSPRSLQPTPDQIQAIGLDLRPALDARGVGLAWAALLDGAPIPKAPAPAAEDLKPRSSLVQVTNLGLTVKDSPQGMLVLVTRLDDGAPVQGARVVVRDLHNRVAWSGTSDALGLARSGGLELRDREQYWKLAFLVSAEKDGDVAYLLSDWTDGIEPWEWGLRYDLDESKPLLRGSVFADRGVYRLGEEVRLKAILRSDTAQGMRLLPAGTRLELVVRDSRGNEIDTRGLALSEWGSAEVALKLPEDGALGRYAVLASVAGQNRSVAGDFLVAAYRRPSFRVDAKLDAGSTVSGVTLGGALEGRYLFGAPMAKRSLRWSLSRLAVRTLPAAILERYPEQRYLFLDQERSGPEPQPESLDAKDAVLDDQGRLALELPTRPDAGQPYIYTLEAEVTDVSRQRLSGRASFRVDPAPFYLGLATPPFFADAGSGLDTQLVAVDLAGRPLAGVDVTVTLTQVQWNSVRRAVGQGYYTWESERKELPAGRWRVRSTEAPLSLHVPLAGGGYFVLSAEAGDGAGRSTRTAAGFYALGSGYTAWARHDHNRIELLPEKKSYRPGETARLLIQSPWERATALLTTEREGVKSSRTFTLESTQQTVEVELGERDVPNLFVSVVLVKGRSAAFSKEDTSDPGKPAFRVGYAELKVEDRVKRLDVALATDREEYRPGARARLEVAVSDAAGAGVAAELTLWAVDYGVLSLTAYRTPDLLGSVWVEKALQVLTEDSRQNIVSRRVLASKGASQGGGGGVDAGPGTVRRDFRPLAFWLGSVTTDAQGKAAREVTLPETLTTFRLMAVAGDKASRFGSAERELRTSKPLLLEPAFPRFLSVGDSARFGAVVHSRLDAGGAAVVTLKSLDPDRLAVVAEQRQTVTVGPRGSVEVPFEVRARAAGRARLQMSMSLLGETDAFEEVVPVRVLTAPETVVASGQAAPDALETIELPAAVEPSFGGLRVEIASTALVGLGEGARYLVDYPYGCAEQRASAALALALAADLGSAFRVEGIEPDALKGAAAAGLGELLGFQCEDGGFAYWKGGCASQAPYLTAYALHVLQRARGLGYPVRADALDRGLARLEAQLGDPPPANDALAGMSLAWQALAAKVLAEGGRNADSHLTRLFAAADRMPVFGVAYLIDALVAKRESGPRVEELARRLENAIRSEAGAAHVEELADPYLAWLWSSDVRSTASALGALTALDVPADELRRLVRYLMQARVGGRWGNTQENAVAMESLVAFYRRHEAEAPDMSALVGLGGELLARGEFRGRDATAQARELEMPALLARGGPGARLPLSVRREGKGTLYYGARLRYVPKDAEQGALDKGFTIERRYAPAAGGEPAESFAAGDLVKVTLRLGLTRERRFVAVRDPLPAGFEPVESAFATTAASLAAELREAGERIGDPLAFWQRGGFDHVERHDDRVLLFATRLGVGEHVFSYLARATTAGRFHAAAARVEEMYSPDVFGRTASATVEVRP